MKARAHPLIAAGLHVLMGSASDASSFAASPYGHGLLTYALLEGMKGAALTNDNDVDVQTLFGYAMRTLPDFARSIGEVQQPIRFAPLGARSFYIGELLPVDRSQITLPAPKPVIVRPEFLNGAEGRDDLGLEALVRAELRDQTNVRSRGDKAGAWFEDKSDVAGAISPSGIYTVTGNRVSLTLRLGRDGNVLSTQVVDGSREELPALAARIVATILAATKAPVK